MMMHQGSVAPHPPAPYAYNNHTPGGGGHGEYVGAQAFQQVHAPQQQVMTDATSRPAVGPLEGIVPGVSRLLYHGVASSRSSWMHSLRGVMCPWTCACVPAVSESLRRSRYVQVYDNKVEINEPDSAMLGCGTCVVRDRITTVHFDRHLTQNASRASGCCSPHCTHGDMVPDCWGAYGETLVLHSDRASFCSLCRNCCTLVDTSASVRLSNAACPLPLADVGALPGCCCFPDHKLVYGLDNAAELAQRINTARQLRALPRAQPAF